MISTALGCGGTYVDDKHNFERAFQTKRPPEVEVIRSVYTQTPHFTDEHEYYFEMKFGPKSQIVHWLTGAETMVNSTNALVQIQDFFKLPDDRPAWFAPAALTNYEIWYNTKSPFIVLLEKQKSEVFVYGSVGM